MLNPDEVAACRQLLSRPSKTAVSVPDSDLRVLPGWQSGDRKRFYFGAGSKPWGQDRMWSVHCFDTSLTVPSISTIGELGSYSSMRAARIEAQRLAEEPMMEDDEL